MFQAIMIDKASEAYRSRLVKLNTSDLPPGDVLVQVRYSTVNFKDALAISGKNSVVRQVPLVPGIDFAGVVAESEDPRYPVGSEVLLNGWGVGEQFWGGFSQFARVKGDWLVPLPLGLSLAQTMAIGTAGYTAMLCLQALERHGLAPDRGPVLVTGASGGVGSIAISLLARRGYDVIASTGRVEEADYLKQLGAKTVIDRHDLSSAGRPLQKERWFAAIDSVGSHTLANACASAQADGLVAACGLAQGMELPASVAPFILRGISLLGINSVTRSLADRVSAWRRLAEDINASSLESISKEISLAQVLDVARPLLEGRVRGRLVVNVNL